MGLTDLVSSAPVGCRNLPLASKAGLARPTGCPPLLRLMDLLNFRPQVPRPRPVPLAWSGPRALAVRGPPTPDPLARNSLPVPAASGSGVWGATRLVVLLPCSPRVLSRLRTPLSASRLPTPPAPSSTSQSSAEGSRGAARRTLLLLPRPTLAVPPRPRSLPLSDVWHKHGVWRAHLGSPASRLPEEPLRPQARRAPARW